MSFSTLSLTLDGVNGYIQGVGYTRGEVFSVYSDAANYIKNINPNVIDVATLNLQLNNLVDLLKNGKNALVDPLNPQMGSKTYYMTVGMAQQLQSVFDSLQISVGVDVTQPINMTAAQATDWLSFINSTGFLNDFYAVGNDPDAHLHSIQSIVELQYVKTGNDVMASQIGDLEFALNTTQQILSNMQQIQNLHNNIAVYNQGSFTSITGFNWSGSNQTPTQYVDTYRSAASTFYGNSIVPVLVNQGGIPTYQMSLTSNKFIALDYLVREFQGGTAKPVYVSSTGGSAGWRMTVASTSSIPQGFLDYFNPVVTDMHDGTKLIEIRAPGNVPTDYSKAFETMYVNAYSIRDGSIYNYRNDAMMAGRTLLSFPSGDAVGLAFANTSYHLFQQGFDTLKDQLVKARDDLDKQIQNLEQMLGTTSVSPITSESTKTNESTLLKRLQAVRDDFSTFFVTTNGTEIQSSTSMASAYSGLYNWLIDRYDLRNSAQAVLAGSIQKNIGFGVQTGQALNDTKKLDVQNFLYVFEQYYKSASTVLKQLSALILTNARGIRGT